MSDYKFTMPWPPSVNQWKTPFKNRAILTRKGREYRTAVAVSMTENRLSGEMLSQRLKVTLTLNPPTARRYDVDNFSKSLFDALTHCGFWVDDEQVDVLVVRKGQKTAGGNVEVSVEIME